MLDLSAFKFEPKLNVNLSKGKRKPSIGILNQGKNNKFINNQISGFDIGIKDQGWNSLAKDNEIK